ncbi:hypothetical protein PRZ48_003194 [Zasmidium cellare]|uniref:Uncharacterized protein n=1 Tax=Zasmidium cellare TaxID=395010 RepID=A0ABR0EUD3_ZASCE|nr:hypothetical protein PRZ48_003194 [Zasmidium cellare]
MPDQPFLYDAPTNRPLSYPYSDFNPRAATQAHYAAFQERAEKAKRRAAQDGKPLINFNQHPDSYMIVANPGVNHEPLPPSTKKNIIWTRWVQFVLRLFQEVGALGILVCVICLKMQNDGPGWIIRVAPAWDSVITMYAVYHLIRPAKGRTPSSSGSYHFFSLFMDTGLIPFYIFIALYSNQNYDLQPGVDNRWTSFFSSDVATTSLIFATFIASIVMASLHLISIGFDLYLIVMFRKIARLPPDMNPLEDNLTGSTRRSRSQRHKHKDSNFSSASTLTGDMPEKDKAYYSGSTLDMTNSRLSVAKEPEARTIPFGHSRMDSDNSYSPHNPRSAHLSRQQTDEISLHQGPRSARSSRHDVGSGYRSRAGTLVDPAQNTDVVDFAEIPPVPSFKNHSRPTTAHNGSFVSSRGTADRMPAAPTTDVVKSQQKQSLLNDNWYVLDEEAVSDLGSPRRQQHTAAPPYSQNPTLPNVELDELDRHDSFQPQPLKMNPPTPPPQIEYPDDNKENTPYAVQHQNHYENYAPIETGVARTLTVASHNTASSSVYSDSPSTKSNGRPNNGTPKGKYYGDLASAQRNIRGAVPLAQTQFPALDRGGAPVNQKTGRVISRTGADITDVGLYSSEQSGGYGLRGRRDVSGKVAEEGRGGHWR